MKTILIFLLTFPFILQAHPGVGIVEDSKGNIFYTDLTQVLKISPNGIKSVVVKNVHTHELFIDEHDNLYGEHLWYNGERLNTWGHFVWRLSPNGRYEKVIPDTSGFREDYSFVRDHSGRMYWADRTTSCQKIARKNADNTTIKLGDQCFHNIRFMNSTEDGEIYLVDYPDLKKIDRNGKVKTIAIKIGDLKPSQFTTSEQNSIMGIWNDPQGNIYTAITSARVVKKFSPQGKEEIIFTTSIPWSPSGGMIDSKGNLWVLECSMTNAVRVEKLQPDRSKIEY